MTEGLRVNRPGFMVSLGSLAFGEGARLVRIPIAMLGRWVKEHQRFSIRRDDITQLVRNFRKRKTGEVVIDYEHASESPEMRGGGPAPAAGWLRSIEDEPDGGGILWGMAEFTQRARKLVANLEYKYLSPALDWGARDKATGEPQGITLTSLALVNRPFLEALPAVQLSEAGWNSEQEESEGMSDKSVFSDLGKLNEYIHKESVQKMEGTRLTYREALLEVARENPALMQLREALYLKRARERGGVKEYALVNGQLVEVEDRLDKMTKEAVVEHPELSYGAALKLVASEHPNLLRRRETLIRRKIGG